MRKETGFASVDVNTIRAHSGGSDDSPASVAKTTRSLRLCVSIEKVVDDRKSEFPL